MFWFFDTLYNRGCPNPKGRCVARYRDGTLYYLNGKIHRMGNPAIVWADDNKEWYYEGKLHRPLGEGPDIEYAMTVRTNHTLYGLECSTFLILLFIIILFVFSLFVFSLFVFSLFVFSLFVFLIYCRKYYKTELFLRVTF